MVRITAKGEGSPIVCAEAPPEPCALVIFGASGELSRRKLIPAIFNLWRRDLLPEGFRVVGFARSAMTTDEFRRMACAAIGSECAESSPEEAELFTGRFEYLSGGYSDPASFEKLSALLEGGSGRDFARVFYLALPPDVFPAAAASLGRAGLVSACEGSPGCARVVVEKPFGRDARSAGELDAELKRCLVEDQIYRIDHYLGKEAVQGLMMLRFANRIFEPIWNRDHVDHVQITVAESEGVGHRGPLYERSGLMRDMFENHLLQLLSLVAMEPPASFEAEAQRDARYALLKDVRPLGARDSVRGQYEGYREEKGVAPDSSVETFAAAKLSIDNGRWRGVPFYLRSGKMLQARKSEIAVVFKRVPRSIFPGIAPGELAADQLVITLQPDEGIELSMIGKGPGAKLCISGISLDMKYSESFGEGLPEAYERLLIDCMRGDRTLFMRCDALKRSWEIVGPLLEAWSGRDAAPPELYAPGSECPGCARELMARDGRLWRPL